MKDTENSAWKPLAILIIATVVILLTSSTLADLVRSAQDEVQLSGAGNLAAEPRADMSDDGTYLAATWVESVESSDYRGDIMLRRATWNSGQSTYVWDATSVTVFDASGDGRYLYADIDVQGDIAHIVAIFQFNDSVRIAYQQYGLTSLTPSFGADGQTVFINPSFGTTPAGVKIAASADSAKPYIVFARNDGEIYYLRWDTSNTSPVLNPPAVSKDDAYQPQMVYTSGTNGNYVHFLWEKRLEAQDTGYPRYRRCQEDGVCSDPVKLDHQDTIAATYPSPFLAAHGERLVAGWQRCTQGGGSGTYCKKFSMVYTRSDNAGGDLVSLETGEYPDVDNIGEPTGYKGTDHPNKIYRARLQPSLTMDENSYPHVAWQIATDTENERHTITTTLAFSQTATAFLWTQLPGLEIGSSSRDYVKPVILVPHTDKDPGQGSDLQGLHLFYMRGSVSHDPGFGVYYTYLQEIDPSAIPTDDPSGEPTGEPTDDPTGEPTDDPTGEPTDDPTGEPTDEPDEGIIFMPLIMRG